MNIVNRNTLKQWFVRGAKPLAAQFAAWIDSFWHKEDAIPANKVEGLQEAMDEKASRQVMESLASDLDAHYTDATAHVDIREAITGAVSTHNVAPDAHADIRQEIADAGTKIKALQGVGGYLTAHDFGSATPSQQTLTDYALDQIRITDALEIFNGTRVKNTFDNHVWVLANTPETDPPVFQWMDDGEDVVDVPNSSIGDISADADDTVVTSGTLVDLLKSIYGRIKALLDRFHTLTGHNHDGSNSRKIAYGDIAGTPSSLPANGGNADTVGGKTVAQILVGAGFTFIIDSDELLAAWANNAAGNDYTAVLIKPGTWTSNKEVNLTTAGTKTIVGMPGNKLLFTSTNYGLTYSTIPTSPEYWMKNVNMLIDVNSSLSGFANCTNLMNCFGTSSGSAFRACTNLTNCNGVGVGVGTAFFGCTYLMRCVGAAGGNSSAFYNCRIMSFCKPGPTQSTSNVYNGCYMHAEGTNDPVSDTAAGGWNRS